jgi:hypothetical protein
MEGDELHLFEYLEEAEDEAEHDAEESFWLAGTHVTPTHNSHSSYEGDLP